ncbi:MAG: hypothetical protein IPM80_17995 [Proteobacteria bacterium]|nr:hypothetical protein [Pseudomonadota bacterium]
MLTRNQMIQHPQVLANDPLQDAEHPQVGALRQWPAARFRSRPGRHTPWRAAPRRGYAGVAEELGFDDERVGALAQAERSGARERQK